MLVLALLDAAMNVYATTVPMATMMLNLVHGKWISKAISCYND